MNNYQHHWQDNTPVNLTCSKVVCVGKNYADHIKELNSATPTQPVLFIKPTTALCDANETLTLSHLEPLGELHHELEVSILIGHELSSQSDNHIQAIAGVGLGIDLTLRDVQSQLKKQGLPWERSKSFDHSCALSPFIKFDQQLDLTNINFELILNDKVQQSSNSSLMLNPIAHLLKEISAVFTLLPGDVILTGTPAGVSALKKGDTLSASLNEHQLIKQTSVS